MCRRARFHSGGELLSDIEASEEGIVDFGAASAFKVVKSELYIIRY